MVKNFTFRPMFRPSADKFRPNLFFGNDFSQNLSQGVNLKLEGPLTVFRQKPSPTKPRQIVVEWILEHSEIPPLRRRGYRRVNLRVFSITSPM
jgi:hypothetical protein